MENDIEQLKASIDLARYIAQTVPLRKRGRIYQGYCPFHADKRTPSFTVYPETQSYYCFGCGAAGDIFTWLEQMEGLTFKEALDKLSDTHLELQPLKEFIPKRKIPLRKNEIPVQLARYWHAKLNDRRSYFHERGFTDGTIDRELWGWTGYRYALTVWDGRPQESPLVQVRLRKPPGDESEAPKYVGLEGGLRAATGSFRAGGECWLGSDLTFWAEYYILFFIAMPSRRNTGGSDGLSDYKTLSNYSGDKYG